MDIFLCGQNEVQPRGDEYPWEWPPCPHPDVQEDGICLTCEHKVT